jgi:hypothetical protein
MSGPHRHSGRDELPKATWSGPERRRHPRWAIDTADGAQAAGPLDGDPTHPSFLARLLARLGLTSRTSHASGEPRLTWQEARRERLPGIVTRLEIVLAELDGISAWREATEVCSALDRLKAEIAADNDSNARGSWTV